MNVDKELKIDEKTKISMGWLLTSVPFLVGGLVYIADIRSDAKIADVKIQNIEKTQKVFEEDVKIELRRISDKLDTIIENTNNN